MRRLLFAATVFALAAGCNPPQKAAEGNPSTASGRDSLASAGVPVRKGPLEPLAFFLGLWSQTEGPDLVSYEKWDRGTDSLWTGSSWTLYQNDTVFSEKLELKAEGSDIYYIPTVKENDGPVRFKMTKLEGKNVLFENPGHDFPQKISYEGRGDTMLYARISAVANGKETAKAFPLRKVGK